MSGHPSSPPPDRPEVPAGIAEAGPRWPWGFGFLAFAVAILITILLAGIAAAVAGVEPGEEKSSAFTVVATVIQDAALVLAAILFAALVARPRAWHFGLRRTAFWPAVGWAALGVVAFYAFAGLYSATVDADAKQRITESLGADKGTVGLIVAGCVVMILAPLAEEFFFRGFFYRALRGRFGVLGAALVDGVVFGFVHYSFEGLDQLLILPPLMALGVIYCLVYEQTGSLWPVVAMHAFNNAVAYGVQTGDQGGWKVSLVVGPLMIGAAMLAPRLLPAGPRGSAPLPVADPQPAGVR
ncbi:MAG: CPBP family intramembrane metalloprotease [Actinomycetota bacterium]|nr:CPBP family intramembrane metalloprotease [Actinomycetota bacterium]